MFLKLHGNDEREVYIRIEHIESVGVFDDAVCDPPAPYTCIRSTSGKDYFVRETVEAVMQMIQDFYDPRPWQKTGFNRETTQSDGEKHGT